MIQDLLQHGTGYALVGAFAGLVSGMLGIGGGVVVVPALAYLFRFNANIPVDFIMHMAVGTSLAIMVFTAQAAARARNKKEAIHWSIYQKLAPGIAIGTVMGAIVTHFLSTFILTKLFAVFLLIVALKMMVDLHKVHHDGFPRSLYNHVISTLIGFKSGLIGVGGGLLIIPYLTYCGVKTREVATVTSVCTLTIATIGTLTFIISGFEMQGAPKFSSGYVYWPAVLWVAIPSAIFAPLGAALAYRLPVTSLKLAFIVVILMTATDMLL